MAVNETRSQNSDFAEGASDSKYKKVVNDRGGVVESTTYASRRDLNDLWFGIHEARTKVLGDGSETITPDFVETPLAHIP